MGFTDLVEARRSVHDYADEPVDRDTVEAVVYEATLAPSSYNLQPWEFLLIRTEQLG